MLFRHSVDPKEQRSCKVRASTGSWADRGCPLVLLFRCYEGKGAAGLVWDGEHPRTRIADPQSVVVGTSMSAPPLRDEQERADLIAYLALSGRYRP
jgi:hypothetical protein